MKGSKEDYYALAGKRAYLIRNRRGIFSERWTGFWTPPIRALDWFTYGCKKKGSEGVVWQCEGELAGFDYDFVRSRLQIDCNDLRLEEEILIPERKPSFFLHLRVKGELDKLLLCFQANLGIEDNSEEPPHPPQSAEVRSKGVIVKNSGKEMRRLRVASNQQPAAVHLGLSDSSLLTDQVTWAGSEPSGRQPRCLVYEGSDLFVSFDLLPSVEEQISGGQKVNLAREMELRGKEKRKEYNKFINSTVKLTPEDFDLPLDLKDIKYPLKLLYASSKTEKGLQSGLYAGWPYYSMFFGRDTFWSCQGLTAIGAWQEVKSSIRLLASKQSGKGRLPHEVWPSGRVNYPSVDSTPLFIIAVADYYRWTADESFLKEMWSHITKAFDWAQARTDPLFLPHSPELFLEGTTWMDSRDRSKYAVEVQAIWLKALESLSFLAKQSGDKTISRRANKLFKKTLKAFKKEFWNQDRDFLYDRILSSGEKDGTLSVNALVPCMFGYLDENRTKEVLMRFESDEFFGPGGVRTVAQGEEVYNSSYHRGAVWPLSTCWLIATQMKNGREQQGLSTLQLLLEKLASYLRGVVPEVITEQDNELRSCFLQAWSSAMVLRSLVRDLFGIEPRAESNQVLIHPQRAGKLRNLRVGESRLSLRAGEDELKVSNEGGEIEVITPQAAKRVDQGEIAFLER